MLKHKQNSRLATGSAAAFALATVLAAAGCTTNRTPGDGEPLRGGPTVGGTSAPITGSSGGTNPVPPPQLDRLVTSADEAARIMAPHQALQGTVLGPVNPVPTAGRGAEAAPTGRFLNPALRTNPQLTVNSSISSPGGVPVIASGAGEPVGGAVVVDDAGAFFADGAVAPVLVAPATAPAGPLFVAPAGGAVTPTTAAIPVTPGMVAGATASPTAVSSGLTAATTGLTAATPPATVTVGALPPLTAAASAPPATPRAVTAAPFGGRATALARDASVPLRVVTDNTGNVVVSNQGRTSRFSRLLRALRPGSSSTAPVTNPTP